MKTIYIIILFIGTLAGHVFASCYNTALGKDPCPCNRVGGSPVRLPDGCVQREVLDLAAFGGVGGQPIELRRTYPSRYLWWGRWTKLDGTS